MKPVEGMKRFMVEDKIKRLGISCLAEQLGHLVIALEL